MSFYDMPEWKAIRKRIIKRDGYRCRVFECPARGSPNLSVHHIIPRDAGGKENDLNLITLCNRHHDEIEIAGIREIAWIENWAAMADNSDPAPRLVLGTLRAPSIDKDDVGHDIIEPPVSGAQFTKKHVCHGDTVDAIARLREDGASWSEIANHLHYPPSFAASLSAVLSRATSAVSAEVEDELRVRLGLYPRNAVTVQRCKVCKLPHLPGTPHIWKVQPHVALLSKRPIVQPAPKQPPRARKLKDPEFYLHPVPVSIPATTPPIHHTPQTKVPELSPQRITLAIKILECYMAYLPEFMVANCALTDSTMLRQILSGKHDLLTAEGVDFLLRIRWFDDLPTFRSHIDQTGPYGNLVRTTKRQPVRITP